MGTLNRRLAKSALLGKYTTVTKAPQLMSARTVPRVKFKAKPDSICVAIARLVSGALQDQPNACFAPQGDTEITKEWNPRKSAKSATQECTTVCQDSRSPALA